MINKKTLFNIVYAIAIFSAFTSCVGILNEFLNHTQLYGKSVTNLITYTGRNFWIPFIFYFIAFALCALTVTVIVFYLVGILKDKDRWMVNGCIILTCTIIFVLSLVLFLPLQSLSSHYDKYTLSYYDYMTIYAFRSGVMSFIASSLVILFCNILQSKVKNDRPCFCEDLAQN